MKFNVRKIATGESAARAYRDDMTSRNADSDVVVVLLPYRG